MLVLYRSGRQAQALAVYQDGRRVLTEELGIEPGPLLRDLERDILVQSTALDLEDLATEPDIRATYRSDDHEDVGRLELGDGQAVWLREGTTVIGRDPSSTVCLVDSRVSRQHASVDVGPDSWVLHDLGSTNGTRVNGEPVLTADLEPGDVIDLGGVRLTFLGPERR